MDPILYLDEVGSTNQIMRKYLESGETLPKLFTIVAKTQTEGRGQRGNTWVSNPEENLTLSILLRPGTLAIDSQFAVSEYAAIATARTVAHYLSPEQKKKLTVKWPNDIYYNNTKLGGILIENTIQGAKVVDSIIGIGLNVNQTVFPEELPNPISLAQIIGRKVELSEILEVLRSKFDDMYEDFLLGHYSHLHQTYMRRLYRREGLHPYRDKEGEFMASIQGVKSNGQLMLRLEDGEERIYSFKDLVYVPE